MYINKMILNEYFKIFQIHSVDSIFKTNNINESNKLEKETFIGKVSSTKDTVHSDIDDDDFIEYFKLDTYPNWDEVIWTIKFQYGETNDIDRNNPEKDIYFPYVDRVDEVKVNIEGKEHIIKNYTFDDDGNEATDYEGNPSFRYVIVDYDKKSNMFELNFVY